MPPPANAIHVLGDARYIIWMMLVTVMVQFATAACSLRALATLVV